MSAHRSHCTLHNVCGLLNMESRGPAAQSPRESLGAQCRSTTCWFANTVQAAYRYVGSLHQASTHVSVCDTVHAV